MEFKKEEHLGTAGDQKDVVELQRPAEVSSKQKACSRRERGGRCLPTLEFNYPFHHSTLGGA